MARYKQTHLNPTFQDAFRNYDDENDRVRSTYHAINTQQTVAFVKEQHDKWFKLNHAKLTMFDVLDMLASFVDDSDPDTREAQQYHAFQTAERCRELFPEPELGMHEGVKYGMQAHETIHLQNISRSYISSMAVLAGRANDKQ